MHTRSTVTAVLASLALATAAGGCRVADPYNEPAARPTASPEASRSAPPRAAGPTPVDAAAHEGAEPAPDAALPGRPDAAAVEAAVRRFAAGYVNWKWDSLAQTRRDLAPLATGELRGQLLAAAREMQSETERRPSDQANSGEIEGVLVRPGKPIFVVTRETATFGSAGGEQRAYFVYVATVDRVGAAWKLSAWRAVTS
jgi:hypothetical protein